MPNIKSENILKLQVIPRVYLLQSVNQFSSSLHHGFIVMLLHMIHDNITYYLGLRFFGM
jgi:hypothetical protein